MLCGIYWTADKEKYCLNKICRDCEEELNNKGINKLESMEVEQYENK